MKVLLLNDVIIDFAQFLKYNVLSIRTKVGKIFAQMLRCIIIISKADLKSISIKNETTLVQCTYLFVILEASVTHVSAWCYLTPTTFESDDGVPSQTHCNIFLNCSSQGLMNYTKKIFFWRFKWETSAKYEILSVHMLKGSQRLMYTVH